MFVDVIYQQCQDFRIFHIKDNVKEDRQNDLMEVQTQNGK